MSTNNWADQDGRRVSQNATVSVRSDIEDHLSRSECLSQTSTRLASITVLIVVFSRTV